MMFQVSVARSCGLPCRMLRLNQAGLIMSHVYDSCCRRYHLQLLEVPFPCCVAFCMRIVVGDTNHSQPDDNVIGQKLLSLLLLIEIADCLRALNSYKQYQDQGCLPFGEKIRKFRFEVKW